MAIRSMRPARVSGHAARITGRPARAAALLVVPVLLGAVAVQGGQDPQPLPGKPTDPPTLRIPPEELNRNGNRSPDAPSANGEQGGAGEKIREALEGRGELEATGDPILDGVLEVLRSRGSVLEGSALDPQVESGPRGRRSMESHSGGGHSGAHLSGGAGVAEDASRFLLAEQLLKTARMLAAERSGDAQRQRLIEDLRREAARCLAGDTSARPSYPSTPTRMPPVELPPAELPPAELPPTELPPAERAVPADHTEAF